MDTAGLVGKAIPKQDAFLRVLSVICGCGMFVLAVFNFIDYKVEDPIDVFLPIYYAYTLFSVFGALMIIAEFRPSFIVQYLRFLCEPFGKGMFYIL